MMLGLANIYSYNTNVVSRVSFFFHSKTVPMSSLAFLHNFRIWVWNLHNVCPKQIQNKYTCSEKLIFYFIRLNSITWLGEAPTLDTPEVAVASGSTAAIKIYSTSATWMQNCILRGPNFKNHPGGWRSHTPPPQDHSFSLSCTFIPYSWSFAAYSDSY